MDYSASCSPRACRAGRPVHFVSKTLRESATSMKPARCTASSACAARKVGVAHAVLDQSAHRLEQIFGRCPSWPRAFTSVFDTVSRGSLPRSWRGRGWRKGIALTCRRRLRPSPSAGTPHHLARQSSRSSPRVVAAIRAPAPELCARIGAARPASAAVCGPPRRGGAAAALAREMWLAVIPRARAAGGDTLSDCLFRNRGPPTSGELPSRRDQTLVNARASSDTPNSSRRCRTGRARRARPLPPRAAQAVLRTPDGFIGGCADSRRVC